MKKKTIKKIIESKLDKWVASVSDEKVKKAIKVGAIVTGGSIVSMLLNEEVNDFDVYFKTKHDLKIVSEYYTRMSNGGAVLLDGASINNPYKESEEELHTGYGLACENMDKDRLKIWSTGRGGFYEYKKPEEMVSDSFIPLFCSPNAITLSDKLQIVVRFWGSVEVIHKNYDYVHATSFYDYESGELLLRQEALESIITKDLQYIGSKYPVTSVIRAKKFINRGWKISAGQYLKMIFQCSELDLKDPLVLEEQLTGVDIAYFMILIDALKTQPASKVSYTYVAKIIDKIFEN